ncbi:MAG: outer membrane beta-barrel protein [Gammaproteobacteria bacterium]
MIKYTKYTPFFLCLLSSSLLAHAEDECSSCEIESGDFYVSVQGGISFSDEADMEVVTGSNPLTEWDPAPEGYDSDLGDSEVLGASFGYAIHPLAILEVEVANRSSFEYEKYQSGDIPKTRYFDVNNTTVMANLMFNGSGLDEPFTFETDSMMWDPFIKIGAGVAYNTVDNFHSVSPDDTVYSVMPENTETSFAYQLGAGINIRTEESLVIGIGYRYVNAGDFSSNNYFSGISSTDSGSVNHQTDPWEGELSTNEVYIALSYVL